MGKTLKDLTAELGLPPAPEAEPVPKFTAIPARVQEELFSVPKPPKATVVHKAKSVDADLVKREAQLHNAHVAKQNALAKAEAQLKRERAQLEIAKHELTIQQSVAKHNFHLTAAQRATFSKLAKAERNLAVTTRLLKERTTAKQQLDRGIRLMEILKQPQYEPFPVSHQVVMLYSGVNGYLDDVPVTDVRSFLKALLDALSSSQKSLLSTLSKELTKEAEEELKKALRAFRERKGFTNHPK